MAATDGTFPLEDDQVLIVCGGPNAKEGDRFLATESISPVQLVDRSGAFASARWFERFPDRSISCVLADGDDPMTVYVTTGADLGRIDLSTGTYQQHQIGQLKDVHEMTIVGEELWLANTGRDEIVSVDRRSGAELRRFSLGPFRQRPPALRNGTESFHVNQAYEVDGHMVVLVHHVFGFRPFADVRGALTAHGRGGLIDTTSGERYDLRLQAPHALRRWRDGFLVFDSGRYSVVLLSKNFEPVQVVPTRGWGRGAAIDRAGTMLYAGISPIRRRYARQGDPTWIGVEMIDLESLKVSHCDLRDIEQVHAVSICRRETAERLASL